MITGEVKYASQPIINFPHGIEIQLCNTYVDGFRALGEFRKEIQHELESIGVNKDDWSWALVTTNKLVIVFRELDTAMKFKLMVHNV